MTPIRRGIVVQPRVYTGWPKAHVKRARELAPLVIELRSQGNTIEQIAKLMNERGVVSPRGNVGILQRITA